jgi:membrane-associated phospholipid phosphatase
VFTVFMLRYLGKRAFAIAVLITVLFSMPRLMIGAHWFTDIMVGSLSVVLVGASWWLMTPASDFLVNWLDKKLPKKALK